MNKQLKPCPFCGSEKIGYSIKTTGRWERKYHVAMYCKECHCYGARTLITPTEDNLSDVEKNEEYKRVAIESWNTRKPIDNIVEQLEKCSWWTPSTYDEDGYCNDDSAEVVDLDDAIEIVEKGGAE